MFVTPVIYPPSLLGSKYEFIIHLNPMSGIVTGFRSAILNQTFNRTALMIALIVSCLFFVIGIFYFNKAEDRFADVV